jgi:outer membrane receptor protein involved in Fe transport
MNMQNQKRDASAHRKKMASERKQNWKGLVWLACLKNILGVAIWLCLLTIETASLAAEGLQPSSPSLNAVTNFVVPTNSAIPTLTSIPSVPTNTILLPLVPVAQSQTNQIHATNTNSTATLPSMTVIGDLDLKRDQIAPDLGAVTYTLGQNQIKTTSQGENSSFQQLVLHAPGVVQDEFGEEHVRGDHGDIQYRINGVLLPESLNGFAQEIDPHMINSVTLMTGTLPAQFGDRTAGIFDVTTKSGAQLNNDDVSLYGGSYETIHPSASVGGTTGKLDYFVTASYLHSNLGIDNPMDNSDPLHDTTDQEKAFGYFSYLLNDFSRVTLLTSASYGNFEIPNTAGLSPSYVDSTSDETPDSSSINENQNEQNYYAVLSYQISQGDFSSQVSAFTRYDGIRFSPDPVQDLIFNGNAASIKNSDFANGGQIDAAYNLSDSHTLRAGALATYDIETLDTSSSVFPSSDQFSPSGVDEELPTSRPTQSSTIPETIVADSGNSGLTSGVYLQDEWHLTDHFTLNYGLRYDRFDVSFDHEDQVSPRANLVWQINEATTAHIGYARYFMPPTLQYIPSSYVKDFEYTTDAPFNDQDDPQKVERDHYFDAGISRQITKAWQVNADSYCKLAKNLLDDGQFGTAVILNNFNYSSGLVYGAELSSTYKRGPFSAYGNFSYVQTEAKDINSEENEFPNNELSYLTTNSFQLDHQGKFTGSGGVSYIFMKNTLLHSDFLYGNGLRAGFANFDKLPAYWTFNAGIEYVWPLHRAGISELRFRFDCLNLFNETAEIRNGTGIGIASAAYGPCRSYYGGITAVF